MFAGRSRELGVLRTVFDRPESTVTVVRGLPGVGVSTLVRRASEERASLRFRCPPLPDPLIRQRLALHLRLGLRSSVGDPSPGARVGDVGARESVRETDDPPSWADLFEEVRSTAPPGEPMVLILDDAHRLVEARSRFSAALQEMIATSRDRQRPVHVVLAGRAGAMPALEPDTETTGAPVDMMLRPLPLRAALPFLPGSEPYEKIRAYGVFGGIPGVLAELDATLTVGTNVRRLMLPDSGALAETPMGWLERSVQTPARYVSVLSALSHGDAGWSALSDAVPDLSKSGQIAPYLKRLMELGFVTLRRSLDASPRSRSTRYALTDPFLAFWLRFVLSWRVSERETDIVPHYATAIRPAIRDHLQRMMPDICRTHMEVDALETLGSNARDSGAIWNAETDIAVAGTLRNGAVYYGSAVWDPSTTRPDRPRRTPLELLDDAIRETRYGFGRERRMRLVFTGRHTPTWLRREVARRDDARLVDAADLVGSREK